MKIDFFIIQFSNNAEAIRHLVTGITETQARWKPTGEVWSMLEVVNHLADEEREDFRTRLDLILHHPADPWPPIDPPGWVTERAYNRRELAESLDRFRTERLESLAWLKGLVNPAWENRAQHPAGFEISARDMLASWLAHDSLHLRQLVELRYQYLAVVVEGCSVAYAGDW